jgi:hypothetical protein
VTFFDGTVALNATPIAVSGNGTATFQLTGLPTGTALVGGQSLTAVYTPDSNAVANGYLASTSTSTVLTVGTSAEIVLNQLFKDLLGRAVNQNDLQFWVPQLVNPSNSTSTPTQQAVQTVTQGIMNSDAFRTQEITWLFVNYLGRTPTANDLSFWLPNFRNGMTIEQAATLIVTSSEYVNDHGGTTNGVPSQQLITALYQDALGRTPQSQDLKDVQGLTLQQLVTNIFSSAEYQGHLVDVFYQDFLRRPAQSGEDQFWVNFLPGGSANSQVPSSIQPDLFVLSGFIGSEEYITDALNNPLGETPVPNNPLQASIT